MYPPASMESLTCMLTSVIQSASFAVVFFYFGYMGFGDTGHRYIVFVDQKKVQGKKSLSHVTLFFMSGGYNCTRIGKSGYIENSCEVSHH